MTELICIVCPKGCHLQVDENNDCAVTGQGCARGTEYGRLEMTAPTRTLTSSVRLAGGSHRRLPVKTDRPIPKGLVFEAMRALDSVTLTAPVAVGRVVVENVCGTGANFVATRSL